MEGELEEKLRQKLGRAFEDAIDGKVAEFGGLLTRRAAIFLLCKQNGIETESALPLSEAQKSDLPFSFTATVQKIFPVQEYGNSRDRSVRLHIADSSGSATLLLWNEQAREAEIGISAGDTIECHGAYFKSGEISVGRNGTVKAVTLAAVADVSGLAPGVCSVMGEVGEVAPDYDYRDRKSGEKKIMSSFQLCDSGSISQNAPGGAQKRHAGGKECRRVVVWSPESLKEKPEKGDVLLLENVLYKNNEIHFNAYSRMVKKKSSTLLSGKIDSLEALSESAAFRISGKTFDVPLAEALALLGIARVPEGVAAQTIISIKAGELAGKSADYRASGGRLTYLRAHAEKK